MPRFSTTRRVRHAASEMFDLVADVEKYPQFLPLCKAMRVRSRREQEDGTVVMVAEMTVAYKLVHQSFTSRATLDQQNLSIIVEYLDGPFKRMQNRWAFEAVGDDACDVEFFIDYEFKSRALSMLMGAMFDTAFRRFSAAFEQRADQVYGRRRN
ncbi:MAG TPA: type II toxin-antitoxin system RatA family toxin [Pseudolabrys sp.]|jgi:coenzyme Q-binding protein COQ10|nr:type II toxin-antitoxin system RatA family toxin [Pseudolabrys sp.]